MRDLYDILGVPRGANAADIKSSYRRLAKELHPDRNPNNPKVAERFKEISAAYDILGDAASRGRYDRGEIDAQGHERMRESRRPRSQAGAGGPGAGGPGADFFSGFGFGGGGGGGNEDIFADLFARGRRGRGARLRGGDRRYTISVSFLDAARGGRRRIGLAEERTLDVNIPAGIDNGQVIRLKGQGEPGIGGEAGDALIEVRVEDHSFFTRKGFDVHVELPVTLKEAVHGARIECPTIDGMVALKVPKRSNTGTQLRLRERGIADAKTAKRGDQHVTLRIVLENAADPALERFVQDWSPKGEDVRRRFRL